MTLTINNDDDFYDGDGDNDDYYGGNNGDGNDHNDDNNNDGNFVITADGDDY